MKFSRGLILHTIFFAFLFAIAQTPLHFLVSESTGAGEAHEVTERAVQVKKAKASKRSLQKARRIAHFFYTHSVKQPLSTPPRALHSLLREPSSVNGLGFPLLA